MSNYYPPVSFAFQVRIAGNRTAGDSAFSEVSGLGVERSVTELKEGGENRFTLQLPGHLKYQTLQLKRGLMLAGSPLFDWFTQSLESDLSKRLQPKDLTVSLLDEAAKPVMSWSVVRAWPVKWNVSDFRAAENEVAIETLDLSFQRIERKLDRKLAAQGFG